MVGDQLGRARFLVAQFGVLMNVAAPRDEFVFDGAGALLDLFGQRCIGRGHQRALRAGRRLRGGRASDQKMGGERQRRQPEQRFARRHGVFSSWLLTCYWLRILPKRGAAGAFVTDA
ncbi:hypothetical protein D3C73_965050 [compost metagenome]